MRLVDEWRQCWKWASVRVAALVAIAPELYAQVGAMQQYVPQSTFNHIMAALGVLVIVGRIGKFRAE